MAKLHGNSVLVKDDNLERALRKFKKKIQDSGTLNDLRDREHFVKPTVKRKLKRSAAKKRWQRQLQSQQLPRRLY